MKRMHLIKDFLQDNDYLIKVYLKDAYFGKPFDKKQWNIFVFNGRETCTSSFACILAWVQPSDIYKSFKESNCIIKKNKYENSNHF